MSSSTPTSPTANTGDCRSASSGTPTYASKARGDGGRAQAIGSKTRTRALARGPNRKLKVLRHRSSSRQARRRRRRDAEARKSPIVAGSQPIVQRMSQSFDRTNKSCLRRTMPLVLSRTTTCRRRSTNRRTKTWTCMSSKTTDARLGIPFFHSLG